MCEKHNVHFEIAKQVFDDPYALVLEDYIDDDGEQRMQAIGRIASETLLLVAYIDQSNDEQIHIHILSARKAVEYEQKAYTDQF